MKNEKGFTLIELLTAMGVATILIAVAIPGMQAFQQNSRQSSSATDLVNGMRIARNTAITTNTRVTICATSSGTSCENTSWDKGWIAFVDQDADRTLDNNETIIRSGSSVEGITISSGQFSSLLVYRPNGRAMFTNVAQNSGQFMICDERGTAHAKGIRIDLSGRPRIYDADGGGFSLSCG